MTDISSRIASAGLPRPVLQHTATGSAALATPPQQGRGALSKHLVAVGDGRSTQHLRSPDPQSPPLLTSGPPALKALVNHAAAMPTDHDGVQRLSQRQLSHAHGR